MPNSGEQEATVARGLITKTGTIAFDAQALEDGDATHQAAIRTLLDVPSTAEAGGGGGGGGILLRTPQGTATAYTTATDTDAAREAKLREAIAAAVDDSVIELTCRCSVTTTALSDSLTGGVTGVKIVFGEGGALIYGTPVLAKDDVLLFVGPTRKWSNFGAVQDGTTDCFDAWLSAYYSLPTEGYYTGPLGVVAAVTATDSYAIGTGSKTFNTQAGLSYEAGDTFRAHEQGNNGNYMAGTVTSYDAETGELVANITATGGSGTIASWYLGTGVTSHYGIIEMDLYCRISQPIWVCAGLTLRGTMRLASTSQEWGGGVFVAAGYAPTEEKFIIDTRVSLGGGANTMHQCGVLSLVVFGNATNNAGCSGVRFVGAQIPECGNNVIVIPGKRGLVTYGHLTDINWIEGQSTATGPGLHAINVPCGSFHKQSVEHFNNNAEFVGEAGDGYYCTSASSVAIGTGAKTFTVEASLLWAAGDPVRIVDDASDANYMEGYVSSYSGTTLVAEIQQVGGSGTKTAWHAGPGPTPAILLDGCSDCVLINPQGEFSPHFLQFKNSARNTVINPVCSPKTATSPLYGYSHLGNSSGNIIINSSFVSYGYDHEGQTPDGSLIDTRNWSDALHTVGTLSVGPYATIFGADTLFIVGKTGGHFPFAVGIVGGTYQLGYPYAPLTANYSTGEQYIPMQAAAGAHYGIRLGHASTYQYVRGAAGHQSAAISNVALTSNVATITTAAAHGFVTGMSVYLTATTETGLNGIQIITGTPTSTSFTFDLVAGDIASAADTGYATPAAFLFQAEASNGDFMAAIGGNGEWIPPQLADNQAQYFSVYFSTTTNKLSFRDLSGVVVALH